MVSPYTFFFPCFKQVVHPSGILPREKAGETWSQQIFLCFVKPLSTELIILVCWSSRREKGRSLSGSQREWRVSSAVRQRGESSEAHEGVETGQQFPGNIPQSGANRRVAVGMPKKAAPEASELSLPPDYRAEWTINCQGLSSWRNHADWWTGDWWPPQTRMLYRLREMSPWHWLKLNFLTVWARNRLI